MIGLLVSRKESKSLYTYGVTNAVSWVDSECFTDKFEQRDLSSKNNL